MTRVNKEKNCYRALIGNGTVFLKFLIDQLKRLEDIQKSLQQFLQAKRGVFPRFYFLSDEDLLEIIGQAKDPKPINKHVKKIFEGTHELEFTTDPPNFKGSNKTYIITGLKNLMGPPEYETVSLGTASVAVDAKVETWLETLRNRMMETIRKEFHKYATA